ncbi:hypothetical protein F5J12DRAFT_779773 [Pisolithus orientalis]|uniref:uncharacterized protein n=1 Tax=Pisolithus orientalis TaxID=936130 RepID=UPI0022253E94|nr:uncharacterized protein F5J12DRAFT_779773 [Pisolithus orientalis]KAI6030678.1 hypothetical protein F5J12DRAFT_779773 [Pisolithus orientalis]
MDAAADNGLLRVVKDAQTIRFLQVALTVLLMYNHEKTDLERLSHLPNELRPTIGIPQLAVKWLPPLVLVTNTISIDKASVIQIMTLYNLTNQNAQCYPALSLWANCLVLAANQIVLQLRLYALYSGSRRVLFLTVPGFVAETIIMIACITLVTVFVENVRLDLSVKISTSSNIALKIYIHHAAMIVYECLLSSAAFSAALRRYQEELDPLLSNWNQLTRLTDILIEGNVISFLTSMLYSVIGVVMLFTLNVEWVLGTLNTGFFLGVTIGCHLILQIRRAASLTSLDYDIGKEKTTPSWPSIIFPYSFRFEELNAPVYELMSCRIAPLKVQTMTRIWPGPELGDLGVHISHNASRYAPNDALLD